MLEKKTRRFNCIPKICQNVAFPLNGMDLNNPWNECCTPCRAASSSGTAWVGNACARSLAPWAIVSISGYDKATSPHQNFKDMVYDYSTHSRLWYLNFIAFPSFVCPKFVCIELPISLHNGRHLFADGFVTLRPIAMKYGWDKENASSLQFRKFHLNPSNVNRKLTMMFKLDLENITLAAFRTPVQNGLMQNVNIFCTENERLYAFLCTHQISYKSDRGIMLIFASEKKRPLLLAKGVYIDT